MLQVAINALKFLAIPIRALSNTLLLDRINCEFLHNIHAVFGWFQDSFIGIERESTYSLSVGYLKGAEQAGTSTSADLMLNVVIKFGNASELQLARYIATS